MDINGRQLHVGVNMSPQPLWVEGERRVSVHVRKLIQMLREDERSFEFCIPVSMFESFERCSVYIHQMFSSNGFCPDSCDIVTPLIASPAYAQGCLPDNQGFFLFASVEIVDDNFDDDRDHGDDENGRLLPVESRLMAVIDRLKQEKRINGGEFTGRDESTNPCSICLEDLSGEKMIIELPCTHFFHESCIVRWLEKQMTCPYCREVPYQETEK